MTLTTDQLDQLTNLLNERLSEFENSLMPTVSKGVMRMAYEVIEEWLNEGPDTEEMGDIIADTFSDGYEMGLEFARKERGGLKIQQHDAGDMFGKVVLDDFDQAVEDAERQMQEHGEWDEQDVTEASLEPEADEDEHGADAEPDPEDDAGYSPFDRENETDTWPGAATQEGDEKLTEPSPATAATLGPEHTIVTPLKPIGRDRLPDPDVARDNLAQAAGSDGEIAKAINRKPRTLADVDREMDLSEIIKFICGLATGGKMPTMLAYHESKPKHLPTWQGISYRHSITSWGEMAKLCGLAYGGKRRGKADEFIPKKAADGPHIPTDKELLSELRRIAMGGVMPAADFFDRARVRSWGDAAAQCDRLGKTWDELAAMAGLKPRPSQPKVEPQNGREAPKVVYSTGAA